MKECQRQRDLRREAQGNICIETEEVSEGAGKFIKRGCMVCVFPPIWVLITRNKR